MRIRKGSVLKTVVIWCAAVFAATYLFSDMLRAKETQASVMDLPSPTSLLLASSDYSLPVLKGLRVDPYDPLKMDFIIDTQNKREVSQQEASLLVRYFLAGLTLKEEDLWVNLSPYEEDRIIPENLQVTEMGRDMLGQDYILKQLSSSLTYPKSRIGKEYWNALNNGSGSDSDNFNKIWITPGKTTVYENHGIAVIKHSEIEVMLEQDYYALQKAGSAGKQEISAGDQITAETSENVMREAIVPQVKEDVNTGENFAKLRQIFHSLILAKWFKQKFKESFYRHYIDQDKVSGVDKAEKEDKDKIYQTYVEAFEKGAYSIIKKEYDSALNRKVIRNYFSGGVKAVFNDFDVQQSSAVTPEEAKEDLTEELDSHVSGSAVTFSINLKALSESAATLTSVRNAAIAAVKETAEKHIKGGIDWAGLEVDAISGSSAILLAPFDMSGFSGFDFDVIELEHHDSAEAMLATFL